MQFVRMHRVFSLVCALAGHEEKSETQEEWSPIWSGGMLQLPPWCVQPWERERGTSSYIYMYVYVYVCIVICRYRKRATIHREWERDGAMSVLSDCAPGFSPTDDTCPADIYTYIHIYIQRTSMPEQPKSFGQVQGNKKDTATEEVSAQNIGWNLCFPKVIFKDSCSNLSSTFVTTLVQETAITTRQDLCKRCAFVHVRNPKTAHGRIVALYDIAWEVCAWKDRCSLWHCLRGMWNPWLHFSYSSPRGQDCFSCQSFREE